MSASKVRVIEQRNNQLLVEFIKVGYREEHKQMEDGTPYVAKTKVVSTDYSPPLFKEGAFLRLHYRPNALEE